MEELVKQIMEQIDLPEDKAKEVIELVLSHLKALLPGPLAGQLDSLLDADAISNIDVGGLLGSIGDLFDKKD